MVKWGIAIPIVVAIIGSTTIATTSLNLLQRLVNIQAKTRLVAYYAY